jgi:hypothetical protein
MAHLVHIDLQQVSIATLIIALGLLVDNPVVANDAIKRQLAAGNPKNLKQVDVLVTIQDNAQAEETRRCHGQSLASYGVTKNVLQTLVELRLRQAGIRVDRSAPAVLYFFIHACQTAYSVSLTLYEPVKISRSDETSGFATIEEGLVGTWEEAFLGNNFDLPSIRESATSLTERFLDEWFKDNVPEPPENEEPK